MTLLLKRAFVALLIGAFVATASPAMAHHADEDAFFDAGDGDAAIWNQAVDEEICFTNEFENAGLSQTQLDHVQQSIWEAFNKWRVDTDITRRIDFGGDGVEECLGNLNFENEYAEAQTTKAIGESVREQFCETRGGTEASTVQYEDLSWLDGRLGMAWTCDTDENNLIDYVIVIIDRVGTQWHWESKPRHRHGQVRLPRGHDPRSGPRVRVRDPLGRRRRNLPEQHEPQYDVRGFGPLGPLRRPGRNVRSDARVPRHIGDQPELLVATIQPMKVFLIVVVTAAVLFTGFLVYS
jgi:hypothetical protein